MNSITGVGAVICRKREGQTEILLIRRNRYGDEWSLPKGKLKTGESLENGLKREIREETGFEIKIEKKIGELHYYVPEGEKIVHYFKAKAVSGEFQPNEEVSEIQWLNEAEAANLLTYADQKNLLLKTNFSTMRKIFDLVFKRNRNQHRRLSATIETLELEIKTGKDAFCTDILNEAKKSLDGYDYDAAWKKIHLLKRELVSRLSADEIKLKSIALTEEANDKLEGWRKAAVQEVLKGDATIEKLQNAMNIMDEHFDNLFHKTSLAKGHVILLLLVLLLQVAAILVFKHGFFVQELSEDFSIQMIFPVMLFGAIGSTFSGVISVAKATKVKIPEQKANFFYQLIRVLLGAVTGLIIYFIITAQITDVLNVEASQFERVLIYCFIAGFSEDYLLMLVDKAKK